MYEWAGQPRAIGIQKADWDDAAGKLTIFANPAMVAAMAGVAFKTIDNGRTLMDLDQLAFAARTIEFIDDFSVTYPFREGGRTQRILLSAIGEAAGQPIAFDVATRERMVATSVAAANGDLGGFTHLIVEATDPRRVEAMPGALGFCKRTSHHETTPTSPLRRPGSATMEPWSTGPRRTS